MYELSLWIEGCKEDSYPFNTLEEAIRMFEKWVVDCATELRGDTSSPIATIKIQKMEDVISVDI